MDSGKFVLRIPPKLHSELKKEARDKQLSLNQVVCLKLINNSPSPLIDAITKTYKESLVGIVIFGSYVRGEAKKSSDIDLLIVLSDKQKIERSLYHIWDEKTESLVGNKYSPQFVHLPKQQASSIWLEVALEGEIVFDPSGQVRKSIYKLKDLISSGQYTRKLTHGHPYWVSTAGKNE